MTSTSPSDFTVTVAPACGKHLPALTATERCSANRINVFGVGVCAMDVRAAAIAKTNIIEHTTFFFTAGSSSCDYLASVSGPRVRATRVCDPDVRLSTELPKERAQHIAGARIES